MAICYARLEFLKRTSGKNAVAKSAYNSRGKAHFEGNQVMAEKTYSWLGREKPAYHQIMLPGHVDRAYLSAEFLWNAVEKAERKKNAVVGSEVVLALPDDDAITLEDKIELTKSFVHQNFISKGFAAQIDIHSPENAITRLRKRKRAAIIGMHIFKLLQEDFWETARLLKKTNQGKTLQN